MESEMNIEIDHDYESRKYEELRNLYSWVLDDIRFQKNLQMSYLYYTIGLYSAIIFLLTFFPSAMTYNLPLRIALTVLSMFIFLVGVWFMYITQQDISKARLRVSRLLPYFTKEFNLVLEGEKYQSITRKLSKYSYLIFISILILGEGIVLSIVWFF